MTDLDNQSLTFRARRSRYALMFFSGLFLLLPLAFLVFTAVDLAQSGRADSIMILIVGVLGFVWLCSLITNIVVNTAAHRISINKDAVDIYKWFNKSHLKISEIERVRYIETPKWKYIVLYTDYKYYIVANLLFSDREIDRIVDEISAWFEKIGRRDLIQKDKSVPEGITRNRMPPAFEYVGIWKCIVVYSFILIAYVLIYKITGIRLTTLLGGR